MHTQWIWQHPQWPNFYYEKAALQDLVYEYGKFVGKMMGNFTNYPEPLKTELLLDIITFEALNTSAIEGEHLKPEDIRSSLRNQLGLDNTMATHADKRAQGISAMMLQSREAFAQPLDSEMLFQWHEKLMMGLNPYLAVMVGHWRVSEESMQVVSGPIGRQTVHYEAPPSALVDREMQKFIQWFNQSQHIPGPIRAGIAHLYFECIHPFDDGNGRIGRAIAEKALSQDLNSPIYFSLSTPIEKNKKAYYDQLGKASRNHLDITPWLEYFLSLLIAAEQESQIILNHTLKKAQFWKTYAHQLNTRQEKLLQRMFQEGIKGFEGGISAKKYMKMLDVSKATATRDLSDLYQKGCLRKLPGEGRSTRYALCI